MRRWPSCGCGWPTWSPTTGWNKAARTCLDRVCAVQSLGDSNPGIRGAIPGSRPVRGGYFPFEFPNWGAKFFVDACSPEGAATLDRRSRRSSAQRRMIEGALDTLASRSTTMDLTIIIATADRPARQSRRYAPFSRAWLPPDTRSAPACSSSMTRRAGPPSPSRPHLASTMPRTLFRDDRRNPSSARSWGIRQVETEFVGLFDDDDEMLPDHIRSLTGRLARGADVCATGYWLAYPNSADPCRLVRGRAVVPAAGRLVILLRDFQPVNDQSVMRDPRGRVGDLGPGSRERDDVPRLATAADGRRAFRRPSRAPHTCTASIRRA